MSECVWGWTNPWINRKECFWKVCQAVKKEDDKCFIYTNSPSTVFRGSLWRECIVSCHNFSIHLNYLPWTMMELSKEERRDCRKSGKSSIWMELTTLDFSSVCLAVRKNFYTNTLKMILLWDFKTFCNTQKYFLFYIFWRFFNPHLYWICNGHHFSVKTDTFIMRLCRLIFPRKNSQKCKSIFHNYKTHWLFAFQINYKNTVIKIKSNWSFLQKLFFNV